MKTIVVDGLSAVRGGGVTYLQNLFANAEPVHVCRVVAVVPPDTVAGLSVGSTIELLAPAFPARGIVHRFLWYRLALPNLLRCLSADLLYCPGGTIPGNLPAHCKTAVAFRNMLPFAPAEAARYPMGYTRLRLRLLRLLQMRSFQSADLLIFLSHHARTTIDELLPARRGESAIIPHGLSEQFRDGIALPRPIGLPDQYVLYVSILDVYKAQVEVVHAWDQLRRRRASSEKLVLVGPQYGPYARKVKQAIRSLGLEGEVILRGNVPYSELPAYYHNAKVNVFASSCENCPNILLEALASGRPLLSSSYPPMPEFARDAALYFDPYEPRSLADKLVAILDDRGLIDRMGTAARARSLEFSWRVSAAKTWQALRGLV